MSAHKKELTLRVICMDCRTIIQDGDPGAMESHGLCDRCFKVRMDELTRLGYAPLVRKQDGAA